MKGIIFVGSDDARLHPLTLAMPKCLVPVYNKPMIYYPLSMLMLAGIREILIISGSYDLPQYRRLLGDGSQWGISISYAEKRGPDSAAQAYVIGADFIDGQTSALILGDNFVFGHALPDLLNEAASRPMGASIFAHRIDDPTGYNVVTFYPDGRPASIEERSPETSLSDWAVTGLYIYDSKIVDIVADLQLSASGELKIININRAYLERSQLHVGMLGRGFAWFDMATHDSLLEAAAYVRSLERRQGLRVACPEEIAFLQGFIDSRQLVALARKFEQYGYGQRLLKIAEDGRPIAHSVPLPRAADLSRPGISAGFGGVLPPGMFEAR